jgi:hypothetical protein
LNGYFSPDLSRHPCLPIENLTIASLEDWRNFIALSMVAFVNAKLCHRASSLNRPIGIGSVNYSSLSSQQHLVEDNISAAVSTNNSHKIFILPAWEITAPLWSFHIPIDLKPVMYYDCTHYPSFPTLNNHYLLGIAGAVLGPQWAPKEVLMSPEVALRRFNGMNETRRAAMLARLSAALKHTYTV